MSRGMRSEEFRRRGAGPRTRLEELDATLTEATGPDESLTVRELAEQFNV